jgi:co-chaperonin GroES (HSP10)
MTKAAFAPHRIDKDQLIALQDTVLVSEMLFDARITTGGIYIPNDNGTGHGIRPRWGKVYAVGPKQTSVKVGQWICVAHGRWTRGLDIEDETGKLTIRKIDPKDILLISDLEDAPNDQTFSDAVHIAKKTMPE